MDWSGQLEALELPRIDQQFSEVEVVEQEGDLGVDVEDLHAVLCDEESLFEQVEEEFEELRARDLLVVHLLLVRRHVPLVHLEHRLEVELRVPLPLLVGKDQHCDLRLRQVDEDGLVLRSIGYILEHAYSIFEQPLNGIGSILHLSRVLNVVSAHEHHLLYALVHETQSHADLLSQELVRPTQGQKVNKLFLYVRSAGDSRAN